MDKFTNEELAELEKAVDSTDQDQSESFGEFADDAPDHPEAVRFDRNGQAIPQPHAFDPSMVPGYSGAGYPAFPAYPYAYGIMPVYHPFMPFFPPVSPTSGPPSASADNNQANATQPSAEAMQQMMANYYTQMHYMAAYAAGRPPVPYPPSMIPPHSAGAMPSFGDAEVPGTSKPSTVTANEDKTDKKHDNATVGVPTEADLQAIAETQPQSPIFSSPTTPSTIQKSDQPGLIHSQSFGSDDRKYHACRKFPDCPFGDACKYYHPVPTWHGSRGKTSNYQNNYNSTNNATGHGQYNSGYQNRKPGFKPMCKQYPTCPYGNTCKFYHPRQPYNNNQNNGMKSNSTATNGSTVTNTKQQNAAVKAE